MAACAVMALAAVFSVQQGEHGPLVVYKLQTPDQRTPVPSAPVASSSRTGSTPAPDPIFPALLPPAAGELAQDLSVVIPSRAPAVLGTVVLPAAGPPPAAAEPPPAATEPAWIPEGTISLQQVSDEILWRRDTAERLPEAPFAPRF